MLDGPAVGDVLIRSNCLLARDPVSQSTAPIHPDLVRHEIKGELLRLVDSVPDFDQSRLAEDGYLHTTYSALGISSDLKDLLFRFVQSETQEGGEIFVEDTTLWDTNGETIGGQFISYFTPLLARIVSHSLRPSYANYNWSRPQYERKRSGIKAHAHTDAHYVAIFHLKEAERGGDYRDYPNGPDATARTIEGLTDDSIVITTGDVWHDVTPVEEGLRFTAAGFYTLG